MQLKSAEVVFSINYIPLGNRFDFLIKKIVSLYLLFS